MRKLCASILPVLMLAWVLSGCQAVTGETLGQNIDDTTITTTVKTRLAAEKGSTLTRVQGRTKPEGGARFRRARCLRAPPRCAGQNALRARPRPAAQRGVGLLGGAPSRGPPPPHKNSPPPRRLVST